MRAFFVFLLLLGPDIVWSADLHLTPNGAGQQNGTSWEDALPGTSLQGAYDKLQPGDRLLIGSGTYLKAALELKTGGVEGKPKTILGVDREGEGFPVFTGSWNVEEPARGGAAISVGPGVSYITVQHLRLKHYAVGINAGPAAEQPRSWLVFDDVDVEQHRHGFYLSDCHEVRLTHCDLQHYTKHGFRLEQGCQRVEFDFCTADCSQGDLKWETQTEVFPFGFTVNNGGRPNTQITFEDCLARNNMKSNQGSIKYTNGDGFMVEENARDVSFKRCRALRNQDGGFDLKTPGVQLIDCVALNHRRDFRIWNGGTLRNCFAGWSATGLWSKSGGVTAERCTFMAHAKQVIEMDDDAAPEPMVLTKCLIIGRAKGNAGNPGLQFKDCVSEAMPPGDRISIKAAQWDGTGAAMDSPTHPGYGYQAPK